jgi:hypothetical protein
MRFRRRPRHTYEWTHRKALAVARKLRREREACPLAYVLREIGEGPEMEERRDG